MNRKQYKNGLHVLAALFFLLSAGIALFLWIYTAEWAAAMTALAGCALFCLLAWMVHRLDDRYITGIVADLSALTDMLMELEEKEIFAENEDTVLSKLQSKVTKLVRILRNRNRQAEQEQEKIKGLVSDISHQLKTPIATLKMYSEFLADEALPPEKREEYVRILRLSVERLNFLSENMIKISRLESGLIALDIKLQSLNGTVMKSIKDVYQKAEQKQVELAYSEEGEAVIPHDRNWTAEAVFNLLDNAVKYARSGSRIFLRVRQFGMFAEVAVEDENGGIPAEERTKIFMRFYRGRNSRDQEGVGIGLYLSREIVMRQGGYMKLRVTDKGNIFSVVFAAQ